MKQIADIKYNLDDNMKMNVLEPLHQLATKDIKEVQVRRRRRDGMGRQAGEERKGRKRKTL